MKILILVTDASICFDLYHGDLLQYLKALPFKFAVTDIIADKELQEPDINIFLDFGFTILNLSSEDMQEVFKLKLTYNKPSIGDLSGLISAKKKNGILLTGDKRLREAAEIEKVKVKGVLWILDQLVDLEILPIMNAIEALQEILNRGSRLPKDECEKRFKHWHEQIRK